MSLLTYNNVKLPYGLTTMFNEQAIYDDSKTDYMYTEYDIQVQCLINWNYMDMLAPDLMANEDNPDSVYTENPAAIMQSVSAALMEPRHNLSFTFNGVDIIPPTQSNIKGESPLSGIVDVANGPMPQHCRISKLTNTLFIMDYRIIARYILNIPVQPNAAKTGVVQQNIQGNNVLSNRWSEAFSLDETGFAKRNRKGKMVIRSDNYSGFAAWQTFPQMCIVGVPGNNWIRKASNYILSPDGLSIQYSVEDLQVYKLPPVPAYKAEGNYWEETGFAGMNRKAAVQLTLWGSPLVSQADLLKTALSVALTKGGYGISPAFASTAQGIFQGAGLGGAVGKAVGGFVGGLYGVGGIGAFIGNLGGNIAGAIGGGVAGAKNAGKPIPANFAVPTGSKVETDLYNNKVSVYFEWLSSNQVPTSEGLGGISQAICLTPGSDSKIAQGYDYGTIPKDTAPPSPNIPMFELGNSPLLQAANYYDPKNVKLKVNTGIDVPVVTEANPNFIIKPGLSQLSAGGQPGTEGKNP